MESQLCLRDRAAHRGTSATSATENSWTKASQPRAKALASLAHADTLDICTLCKRHQHAALWGRAISSTDTCGKPPRQVCNKNPGKDRADYITAGMPRQGTCSKLLQYFLNSRFSKHLALEGVTAATTAWQRSKHRNSTVPFSPETGEISVDETSNEIEA